MSKFTSDNFNEESYEILEPLDIELETRYPRASKRTTYFDVIERVRISESIGETSIDHPPAQRTVGSIKIADLKVRPRQVQTTTVNITISGKVFSWKDLEFDTTQIEDIGRDGDYEVLAKLVDIPLYSVVHPEPAVIKPTKPDGICGNCCKDQSEEETKVPYIRPDFYPIEEYLKLRAMYIAKGIIKDDGDRLAEEAKLQNLWNELMARDREYADSTRRLDKSGDDWYFKQRMEKYGEKSDDDSDTDSLDWLEQLGMERFHIPGFCKICPSDMEERFKMDSLSDFSLQRIAVGPAVDKLM